MLSTQLLLQTSDLLFVLSLNMLYFLSKLGDCPFMVLSGSQFVNIPIISDFLFQSLAFLDIVRF